MRRTTRKNILVLAVASAVALGSAAALGKGPPSGGGGGHTETQGNNLSFPAIAADGFSISALAEPSFTVPYSGEYPGLTDSEVTLLETTGPWYAQKTEGNVWQADFTSQTTVAVDWIDWGDKIESSSPMLRRPFRLELALYEELSTPMTAYTMAVLEYPSSANELQGTNKLTYDSNWATVATNSWTLIIQLCEDAVVPDEGLTWTGSDWNECDPPVPMPFGVELNVGGKYIFGGSQGGWKPTETGWYRITFFQTDPASDVDLRAAEVGNYAVDFGGAVTAPAIAAESDEGPVATPVVDSEHNLTYVDVEVIVGGGGGGGKPR